MQKEVPIWVTTAGNPETWIQAGKAGANVLTHLLGQTVEEVTGKVAAYREAWTEAGHAGRGIVTLMLHTLVGTDDAAVEATVRQPMKDYLRSAVALVKAAAWQFPTFRKLSEEQGRTLDEFFADVSGQDMDDLLRVRVPALLPGQRAVRHAAALHGDRRARQRGRHRRDRLPYRLRHRHRHGACPPAAPG